jgi:hypothetical protein
VRAWNAGVFGCTDIWFAGVGRYLLHGGITIGRLRIVRRPCRIDTKHAFVRLPAWQYGASMYVSEP